MQAVGPAPGSASHTPRLASQIRISRVSWSSASACASAPVRGRGPYHWPRTGGEAHALADDRLTRLVRIWLANRGVWEALPGAGPTACIPATHADVNRYIEAYGELLAQLR